MILQLQNLSLRLGNTQILKNLRVDFREGHVHAIVGPNGAGKSTLASTIMGLAGYRHIEGDIIFDGRSIKEKSVAERAQMGISLGWQEPARFEGITIAQFLQAAAGEKSSEAVRDSLEKVGLDPGEYLKRAADKTLSGGERKRVELASLLVMQPRLIVLDEPDSGIDVAALERIFEAIKIFKKQNATVLLITHSSTVLQQAEHAFLMCDGEIIDKGSIDKISSYFSEKCMPCDHKNKPDFTEEAKETEGKNG